MLGNVGLIIPRSSYLYTMNIIDLGTITIYWAPDQGINGLTEVNERNSTVCAEKSIMIFSVQII